MENKINRTEFLKLTGGIFATIGLNQLSAEEEATTEDKSTKKKIKSIIVVGGGLTGLTTAYLLNKKGYDVTLLEASNRFGGRLKSIKDPNTNLSIEMGGEWILKEDQKIIDICKELKVPLEQHSLNSDIFIEDNLSEFKDIDLTNDTKEILQRLHGLYSNMPESQKIGLDKIDIFSYLKYQGISEKDLQLIELKYSLPFGESLRNISSNIFFQTINLTNPYNSEIVYKIQGGTSNLIDTLISKLNPNKIFKEDPVLSIEQNDQFVSVKLQSEETFVADAIIITIPANQLTNIKWMPDLPKEKKLASLRIKYGRLSKIGLFCKNTIMPREYYSMITDSPAQWVYVTDENIKKRNAAFTILASGDRADLFNENNESTKKKIDFYLQKTNKIRKENIQEVVTQFWHKVDYINASRSVFLPNSIESKNILKQPFQKVYFGGEHLASISGSMNSCVLSALEIVEGIS